MAWNNGGRVNAEEAVLPLRTVVILVLGCLGVTTLFWTARGQWDDTQNAIQGTQNSINTLSKEQAEFRAYIADLIVKKGGERDAQFKSMNATIGDLSASLTSSVADLNSKIAKLSSNQDGSHDETVAAIGQIKLQIENIMKDMAVMKCKLPGNDCGKPKR